VMSVALVLLLLGIVAFLGLAAKQVTSNLKENIGFDVVVKENATEAEVNQLKQMWNNAAYMSSVKYVSREDALKEWERETGEDLMEVLGVNPLSAEFEVKVKSDYANVDSLNKIEYQLKQVPGIESVQMHKDVVDTINNNIKNVALILIAVAVVLLIISVALINNTVRLTVYSRRFLIHTMKLVGAKPSFIRRPIVVSNAVNGIIASIIAMVLLSGVLYYLIEFEAGWGSLISLVDVAVVYGMLLAVGAVICALAAMFAANRFIALDYDELFTN
ncbi:MAG: cell division protein FtsX, partial [Muribaculaceae bacterium]